MSSSLDDPPSKRQTTTHYERVFQSIQLDISNVKAINLLSDKSNKIGNFKELLKPSIEIIINSLINHMFYGDSRQLTMELRHDFIIIDSDYKPISDVVPYLKEFFKDTCDHETDQRIGQYMKACQINLLDFGEPRSEYYYFFFIINRNVFPFKLFFLGCRYIDLSDENINVFYINDLMRSKEDDKSKSSSIVLSKKKKDEKKYRDKLTFVDTTDL